MPGIGIVQKTVKEHQLILSQSDIVDLMNEAHSGGVNQMPVVLASQVFVVSLQKANGSVVQLRDLQDGESLIFSFTKITNYEDVATYTDIDLQPPVIT